ncbi:MAG: O-antigen ligase family protein [Candidatus Omnitrophica bacterium]|nr:O-antigen ligase family protein [Candidatus Omnitrophota bacterium]
MRYILLILVFIRPLISSLAFKEANLVYTACLFVFLALWIILKGVRQERPASERLAIFTFLCALCLSIIFSQNKLISLQDSYKYTAAFLLFFVTASLPKKDKLLLIRVLLFSGLIISILAVYQYFFGIKHTLDYILKNSLSTPFALDLLESKRVFFPFVTPNILGGYLAMILPLSFIYKDKYFFIALLLLAILLTKSLGALSSLLLAIIIYLHLEKKIDKRKIIFLFLLSLAIGLIFILRSAGVKQHLGPFFSVSERISYWKDAWKIILQYPLSGVGIGNFSLAHSRYAHNSYLQLWAETGIFGLAAFFWMTARIIKAGLTNKVDYTSVVLSAAAAFLIHNIFDFSFFLPETNLIWWAILGLLL